MRHSFGADGARDGVSLDEGEVEGGKNRNAVRKSCVCPLKAGLERGPVGQSQGQKFRVWGLGFWILGINHMRVSCILEERESIITLHSAPCRL